jgi:predicted HTH transcriptional regulator
MGVDSELIERLLYEEEGSPLDFKRDQYRFSGATDEERSELLKDILAFANAWRRDDAYILIGVEEVRGGKGTVHGVTEHLNDAHLQQFVNAKTQRPVEFAYRAVSYAGNQLGVLQIPLQERPIYLRNNFGRLRANVVYIRRGSSTAEATPDEVARMGELAAANRDGQPASPLEKWVDVSYPADAEIIREEEARGYRVSWCRDDHLARKLDLEGCELVKRLDPDDREVIFRLQDRPSNQTLIRKKNAK